MSVTYTESIAYQGKKKVKEMFGLEAHFSNFLHLYDYNQKFYHLEPTTGIEPVTSPLPWVCSTD